MTTTNFDFARSAILGRIQEAEGLVKQWETMQAAVADLPKLRASLEALIVEEAEHHAALFELAVDRVQNITVAAHTDVLAGQPLAGPVSVTVVEGGSRNTYSLPNLPKPAQTALIRGYWGQVRACIRTLGDTPEQALNVYAAGKLRGYLRG